MRVAIVCEGAPGGEDQQVLEHLARRIRPDADVRAFPQGRKPQLIAAAGDVAQALFAQGFDRVLIMWDVFPRWGKPDGEAVDTVDIEASLVASGAAGLPCLFLIAIHKELEAWLLADGGALSQVLGRPAHPAHIRNTKSADHNANPKKRIEGLFSAHGKPYTPKSHAVAIANAIPRNFGMLGGLPAFKRFGHALTCAS